MYPFDFKLNLSSSLPSNHFSFFPTCTYAIAKMPFERFMYWDDCVDPEDLEAMWMEPEVRTEWLDVGETKGQNVHLSRDPDGEPYLTQTEIKAVAEIVVRRHFHLEVDPGMICALAELESNRQPLAMLYNKKAKQTSLGILQIFPNTADWLVRELGYRAYEVEGNPDLLHKPFVNVYLGAAYLKWLSNFEQKERSEEFVVRAFSGGTKKASHKSTLQYWKRYLSVKESLPSRKHGDSGPSVSNASSPPYASSPPHPASSGSTGSDFTYWDSRASPEDMENMWNHQDIHKLWTKSGERKGKVRFSQDENKTPYVSRVELKAAAEIILTKYFSTRAIRPTVLCALAEIVSMRFVNGVGNHIGIMGIEYSTASWLYTELGYSAYRVESAEDLTKPFVSLYFGAAYLDWLSEYEGRERSPEFVVQAYLSGPQDVNLEETSPVWLKFEQALSNYEDPKREHGSCIIL